MGMGSGYSIGLCMVPGAGFVWVQSLGQWRVNKAQLGGDGATCHFGKCNTKMKIKSGRDGAECSVDLGVMEP